MISLEGQELLTKEHWESFCIVSFPEACVGLFPLVRLRDFENWATLCFNFRNCASMFLWEEDRKLLT